LIGTLLDEMGINAATTLYVGDKREDGEAADANRMPFVGAGWGYGEWNNVVLPSEWNLVDSPRHLL
jgi:phosphoglycolate phosphatase-like HAD superfamily hydrolase